MASHKPYSTPIKAIAEAGEVLLEGPSGLALSLTPDAARASAPSLLAAAEEAEGQAVSEPECATTLDRRDV